MSGPPTLNFKSPLTRLRFPHLRRSASCQVIEDRGHARRLYVDVRVCTARRPVFLSRVPVAAPMSALCTPAVSPQPPTHYARRVDSRAGPLCCAGNSSRRRTSFECLELIYHRPEARPQVATSPFSRYVASGIRASTCSSRPPLSARRSAASRPAAAAGAAAAVSARRIRCLRSTDRAHAAGRGWRR